MTDLQELIDTEWDISTCHCAECYRDYTHVKWFVGAAAVWVTAATVYFLWS